MGLKVQLQYSDHFVWISLSLLSSIFSWSRGLKFTTSSSFFFVWVWNKFRINGLLFFLQPLETQSCFLLIFSPVHSLHVYCTQANQYITCVFFRTIWDKQDLCQKGFVWEYPPILRFCTFSTSYHGWWVWCSQEMTYNVLLRLT